MDELTTLARASGARGEVALRRRILDRGPVEELIVNGTFAMDSTDTSSERELAHLALHRSRPGARLLVGGLGLGYTAAAALRLPVGGIDVVELEPALLEWAGQGLTPTLAQLAADPRVQLMVGDVAAVLSGPPDASRAYDAIVLDVDNGPDFLIHRENASLYTPQLLRAAYAHLAPAGRLAIWCQGPSPTLMATLTAIAPTAHQHSYQVTRGRRRFCYAICTLDRPRTDHYPGPGGREPE